MLAQRPPIVSTISTLPGPLLDSLLPNLSTLASVYHKPPSAFLGHGRSSANALQAAAIEEAAQNARENPIAAAVSGQPGGAALQNNAENLLDIDFDGSAPASMQKPLTGGSSGLEGLAGTPVRVASPSVAPAPVGGGLEDLLGVFGAEGAGQATAAAPASAAAAHDDLFNGFASLDVNAGHSALAQTQTQLNGGGAGAGAGTGAGGKKTNEDLLGLF